MAPNFSDRLVKNGSVPITRALTCIPGKLEKAASMSSSLRAWITLTSTPREAAASLNVRHDGFSHRIGLVDEKADDFVRGQPVRAAIPGVLVAISTLIWAAPVRLPPGRLRLSTSPVRTGSPPIAKTIGIVVVAGFAATAAGVAAATITFTWRRTNSAASAGNRSYWSSAHKYSMLTFWPSIKPASPRLFRNAAIMGA